MASQTSELAPRFIASLLLSSALSPLGSTMIATALPIMATDLHVAPADLVFWLVNAYLCASLIFQAIGGHLGDRWGHQAMINIGLVLCLAGSIWGFFSINLFNLGCARVLLGIGSGLVVPNSLALLRMGTPLLLRGRIFGLFGATMGLAAASGPLLAAFVVVQLGWSSIFLLSLPILSIVAIIGRGAPRLIEHAVLNEPKLHKTLFLNSHFVVANAIIFLQSLALFGFAFFLPFFLHTDTANPLDAGEMLSAMFLFMLFCSFLGGFLCDRYGARFMGMMGMSLSAIASLLFALNLSNEKTMILICLIALGSGVGLAMAPVNLSAMNAVETRASGLAASVLSFIRTAGSMVGISIAGVYLNQALVVFTGALIMAVVLTNWLPKLNFKTAR